MVRGGEGRGGEERVRYRMGWEWRGREKEEMQRGRFKEWECIVELKWGEVES